MIIKYVELSYIYIKKGINIFFSIISLFSIFLLFACTVILISFTVTQVSVSMNISTFSYFKEIADYTLKVLNIDPINLSKEQYVSLSNTFTGSVSV